MIEMFKLFYDNKGFYDALFEFNSDNYQIGFSRENDELASINITNYESSRAHVFILPYDEGRELIYGSIKESDDSGADFTELVLRKLYDKYQYII